MTLALLNNLTLAWILIAAIIFPIALHIAAPYGRHTREDWGPMIDNRWAWFWMEIPALLVVWIFYLGGDGLADALTPVFIVLWSLHYGHRSLIYPFRLRTRGKKMPISIMSSAIFFNLVNGGLIGYYMGNFSSYSIDWLLDVRFLLGGLLFLVGMGINLYSDQILINLRKPGETGYKIPYGGLFSRVSCPNLFGEMLEWLGFALMTWCLPCLSFFIWTVANLMPRALDHHRWYKEKFKDYPKERKAVIPYVL